MTLKRLCSRTAFIAALAVLAVLSTSPTAMTQSAEDDDAQEMPPIPIYDKCVEVWPIEGGPPLIDCQQTKVEAISHTPALVGPMYAKDGEFTLALVDELSPYGTEYRITASDGDRGGKTVSNWSASRCRRFEGLRQYAWHRFEVVARNLNGLETEPLIRWMYYPGAPPETQTPPDDPWLASRIEDVVTMYNLTAQAREMILEIPMVVHRNEPGSAGYWGPNRGVTIGHVSHPWTFLHEFMHAFWEHWDGFPLPCDQMNVYTFRRDLAEFILMFRVFDRTQDINPWEDWRPYYNNLIADFDRYSGPNGETAWELLGEVSIEGSHFRNDIWNVAYHVADTDPPMLVSGKLHLIPPPLRPYFEGFISPVEEAEATTWYDNLELYSALTREDRRLMDFASRYHHRLFGHSVDDYIFEPRKSLTALPEPFRDLVRGADRQALVDFVNTLEDISCNVDCEELWNADPSFWSWYTHGNLIRLMLYRDEIGIDTGIELEESNWKALRQALDVLPACGSTSVEAARRTISSLEGITNAQRAALLHALAERERNESLCDIWGRQDVVTNDVRNLSKIDSPKASDFDNLSNVRSPTECLAEHGCPSLWADPQLAIELERRWKELYGE